MLENIAAAHFELLLGTTLPLTLENGTMLEMTVDRVAQHPLAGLPDASRTPFSVRLLARQTGFVSGPCTFDLPSFGRVENVYVSRIVGAAHVPDSACYELIFG